MTRKGAPHRWFSVEVRRPGGAPSWQGAAAVAAVLALLSCASGGGPEVSEAERRARVQSLLQTSLDLYDGGEFVVAARRFADAARVAAALDDRDIQRNATAGECVSWLRARKLAELSRCGQRLEGLQRKARRSDPGVNTLIALGAIAGGRPLPELRLPSSVALMIRVSAEESMW